MEELILTRFGDVGLFWLVATRVRDGATSIAAALRGTKKKHQHFRTAHQNIKQVWGG